MITAKEAMEVSDKYSKEEVQLQIKVGAEIHKIDEAVRQAAYQGYRKAYVNIYILDKTKALLESAGYRVSRTSTTGDNGYKIRNTETVISWE